MPRTSTARLGAIRRLSGLALRWYQQRAGAHAGLRETAVHPPRASGPADADLEMQTGTPITLTWPRDRPLRADQDKARRAAGSPENWRHMPSRMADAGCRVTRLQRPVAEA